MKVFLRRFFILALVVGSGYFLVVSFPALREAVISWAISLFAIGVFVAVVFGRARKKGLINTALDSTGGIMLFDGNEEARGRAMRWFK